MPVHVDPRSGRVDVAAVEPLDLHIGQEFTFHLDQPVRVLQASHEAVKAALDRLQHGTKVSVLPPDRVGKTTDRGLGSSDAPIPLVKLDTGVRSDAPIPLVRRSMLPQRAPSVVPAARSVPPASALPEADSVALSWRSKPPPTDLVRSAEQERRAAAVSPPAARPSADENPASTRERLEQATSPEARARAAS